jgi:NAD-dependent SIR2 family protein deacetylase
MEHIMNNDLHDLFAQAKEMIREADGLLITAGAGMGVDSGLPDFRGNTGFWEAYPALARAKISFAEIANPAAFRDDPRLAWGFYGHRLSLYRQTIPHPGFQILRWIGERMPQGYFVYTSNVDGQFQAADFAAERIQECHGSIHYLQCASPCCQSIWPADSFLPEVDESLCRLTNALPTCPQCGGLARPNIVMFNDHNWLDQRTTEQGHALNRWLATVKKPLVIELGAGIKIATVRYFSEQHAQRLIRINPTDAELNGIPGISLPMGALAACEELVDVIKGTNKAAKSQELPAPAPLISTPREATGLHFPDFLLDLGEVGWRPPEPFKVNLQADRLAGLREDALQGARLYELMAIQRPGDIWAYVDVIGLALPEQVMRREKEARQRAHSYWRDQLNPLSLAAFDALFDWAGDDTDQEDSAWLRRMDSDDIHTYIASLFQLIRVAQLQASNLDRIARYELALIHKRQHACDRLSPYRWKKMLWSVPEKKHPGINTMLTELERLLRDESIQSVCSRGMAYPVLRLLCSEQLRRAQLQISDPSKAFPISTLSDPLFDVTPWGCKVMWYCEGMGSGDLYFELPGGWGGCDVKELWSRNDRSAARVILLPFDAGEIDGYNRETGYGWVRYDRQSS